MDLQTLANIAQIVGVLWVLFLGAKTIPDLVRGRGMYHIRTLFIGIVFFVVVLIIGQLILPNINKVQSTLQNNTTPTMGKSTSTTPPYIPTGSQLVINDPLKANSSQLAWYDNTGSREMFSCKFAGNSYEVIMPPQYGGPCLAKATNFSNFVYQITMTIRQIGQSYVTKLSDGPVGIVFRSDGGSMQSYEFVIDAGGRYSIIKHSNSGWNGIVGYPNDPKPIPSFNTALGQPNTITLIANGSSFTIYINGQQAVGPVSDTTYSQGMLGVCADGGNGSPSTVVDFSDMKVWQI